MKENKLTKDSRSSDLLAIFDRPVILNREHYKCEWVFNMVQGLKMLSNAEINMN